MTQHIADTITVSRPLAGLREVLPLIHTGCSPHVAMAFKAKGVIGVSGVRVNSELLISTCDI